MDSLTKALPLLQSLLAPAAVVLVFYKADDVLSKDAAKAIGDAIKEAAATPNDSKWAIALDQFLNDMFPPAGQPGKFFMSVLLFTTLSLLFFLAVYTSKMTGLISQLLTQGFLLQFIGNGLLVTLAINWFAYSQYRNLIASFNAGSMGQNIAWILADLFTKAILFVGLTAVIYLVFTLLFGAFRGDVSDALHSVPITIREAIYFRNLTSVYIYSLLLGSFPIYIAVIMKLLAINPAFARVTQKVLFFFPIAEKPIRAAAILFAVLSGAFCLALSVLISPLVGPQ